MPDLPTDAGFADEHREEAIAPGAVLLRGFALRFVEDILAGIRRHHRAGAVPAYDNAIGHGDGGRYDQLRRGRLAD